MSKAPLRAAIFDIGRVLVKLDIPSAIEELSQGISLSPAELWSAIEKDPRWHDWQEGRISPHDWYLHVTKRLASPLKFSEFQEAWNRTLDPVPLQSDDLCQSLSNKLKLALLSNTDPIHVAHLESTYSFFRFFPAPRNSPTRSASSPTSLNPTAAPAWPASAARRSD